MSDVMSKEALQYLVGQGQRSEPKLFQLPCCPPHRFGFWNPVEGQLVEMEAPPPLRAFKALDTDSLVEMLNDLDDEEAKSARVFVNEDHATALIAPREHISCDLPMSMARSTLSSLSDPTSQAEFIREFRRGLSDYDTMGLLAKIRTLKLVNAKDSESNLHHGMESVAINARREASSAGQPIPEKVEFVIPIYEEHLDDADLHETIRYSVDIDIQNGTIALTPIGDDIELAIRSALDEIRSKIANGVREKGIKVWLGSES